MLNSPKIKNFIKNHNLEILIKITEKAIDFYLDTDKIHLDTEQNQITRTNYKQDQITQTNDVLETSCNQDQTTQTNDVLETSCNQDQITQTVEEIKNEYNFEKVEHLQNSLKRDIYLHLSDKLDPIKDFITQFNSSSGKKGNFAEKYFEELLFLEFPNYEIENTSKIGHRGDFVLSKINKPPIMIELKHHKNNVPEIDINKFRNDIRENKICGILISNTGIVNKSKFEIENINENIICYISDFNYNMAFLQTIVKLIHNLYKIKKNNDDTYISIDKRKYQEIVEEYRTLLLDDLENIELLNKIKRDLDISIKKISKRKLPILEKFLGITGNSINENFCKICERKFVTEKNLKKHILKFHKIVINDV